MKIGLVLSGGVAKGAYQIGFLKAVEEFLGRENISCVAGASIGAINGYAFCADKTEILYDFWNSAHFDSKTDLILDVWFKHYLKDVVSEIAKEGDLLKIPLYSPICYWPFIHMQYCKLYGNYNPKWYSFLRGAISFPIISGAPRFFKGQPVVDGGMMDNIPIFPLTEKEKPDLILVLHFSAGFRPRKFLIDRGIPILDYDISINDKFRKHSFDFHHDTLSEMIESGYKYGMEIYNNVFGAGSADIEEILERAGIQAAAESQLRLDNITFETWVERLNAIFYPLTKKNLKHFKDLTLKEKSDKTIFQTSKEITV